MSSSTPPLCAPATSPTPGAMEEDSQLWLDTAGNARGGLGRGCSHPEIQGWGSLCGAGPAQFVPPRAGDTPSSAGGGGKKENTRKIKLIQLQEGAAAAEGAGGGEVSHDMRSVTENSLYSIVLMVLLSTGICLGFSRAREWFQTRAAAAGESLSSPAVQGRSNSSRPSLKAQLEDKGSCAELGKRKENQTKPSLEDLGLLQLIPGVVVD